MKHLLSGVAIVAALAIAAPASAQRTGPGAGAPGPNQPVPGGTQLTGSTASQLNAEELARLQSGNFSMPPAPPPSPSAAPPSTERGPGRQMRREMQR